jgi:glycosyltransferase involved in cell wall biosynthesis
MLLESVRALSRDADLHVVLAGGGPLEDACRAAGATVEVLPFPVLHKKMLTLVGVLRFLRLGLRGVVAGRRLLTALHPDLIYVNTITVPLWLVLARWHGIRTICHVHEAEDALPGTARRALAAPLRLADVVVANSEAAHAVLVGSDRRLAGKVEVLHNGVPGPAHDVAALREVPAGEVQLLLVGRLSHRKGSDVAIEAVKLLADRGIGARLTLAGSCAPGYEGFVLGLRQRVEELGLSERVTFRGFESEVWQLHDRADVVLVPSRFEPFGNVAVEGMLAGRPVIASDTQGLTEIVEDGVSGLVVPSGDPVALADAVARLVQDWPLARRLAITGHLRAVDRFSVDRYAQRLRELASDPRVPARATPSVRLGRAGLRPGSR